MDSSRLYFNGIDGTTGMYGLSPITVEDLSEHILALHAYAVASTRQQEQERALLEKMLQQQNVDKIVGIVRLLAESNMEDVPRETAWHQYWVRKLAQEIAALLPGEEYRQPAGLANLAARLSVDATEKTVSIIELLASTTSWSSEERARKLEALLLREPSSTPEAEGLQAQVQRHFKSTWQAMRKELGRARGVEGLQQDRTAQRVWLRTFIRDLRTLPVDALNLNLSRRLSPGNLLSQVLAQQAGAGSLRSHQLEELCHEAEAQPRDAPWNSLVDLLHRRLDALLETEGQGILWSELLAVLDKWLESIFRNTPLAVRGVVEGIDATDIAQAGWGVIFPWQDPPPPGKIPLAEIRQALEPLLKLRQAQADEYFRIYEKGAGYRPQETAQEFLERHGSSAYNAVDPKKVPYYLLIVGSPQAVPFHFQVQLDVQYAVGRIDFDTVEDYACYARSVVAAETGALELAPTAVFFGVQNQDDRASEQTSNHLVTPLYRHIEQRCAIRWKVDVVRNEEARKDRLVRLMGRNETPAFLFVACHGMEFPKDDAQGRQVPHQGALLCQDWGGPLAERGEIPATRYLAGEDLGNEVNLLGLIGFFFACYSAGTPLFDEYYERDFRESGRTIADRPFTAALPKAMLSRPKGGALAVVGHVERAWGTSYLGRRESEQIAHFESAIERLLMGYPVGWAMEYFNGRYAAVSSELTSVLQPSFGRKPADLYEVAELWTANNDARGYIVIGDPAVRLRVAKSGETATGRPDLSMF
jgi:hypothetical protein